MIVSAASCVLKAKFIDSKRLLETSFEDNDLKMKQLSYNDTLTLTVEDGQDLVFQRKDIAVIKLALDFQSKYKQKGYENEQRINGST